jgi:hypothetical protein
MHVSSPGSLLIFHSSVITVAQCEIRVGDSMHATGPSITNVTVRCYRYYFVRSFRGLGTCLFERSFLDSISWSALVNVDLFLYCSSLLFDSVIDHTVTRKTNIF